MDTFDAYLLHFLKKNTYVATIDGRVDGTYFIKDNQPGLGSHVANAAYMVHSEQHGKGIGLFMANHSIVEAKQLSYEAMQFNLVVSINEPAVNLWKKMGFKIIGTTPHGFKHSDIETTNAVSHEVINFR